jgi:chemotaxis protein methyltransferase CheR
VAEKMDPKTFEAIRQFIYEKSGIFFEKNKEYLLTNRLKKRIDALKIATFEDYIRYLKSPSGAKELTNLFDAVTINETYFFRHINQINAFQDAIAPEIIKRKRTMTIWSAACSSGEEPYTLAIALMEKYGQNIPARILASDISNEILEKAKEGVYGEYSLKELSFDMKKKYFDNLGPGKYKIKDFVKRKCIFKNINLTDDRQFRSVGKMDSIFCRNVLIYFDNTSRQKVIDKFYNDVLNPGGYLVLGATESISRLKTNFKLCHFKMAIAYQKPEK